MGQGGAVGRDARGLGPLVKTRAALPAGSFTSVYAGATTPGKEQLT